MGFKYAGIIKDDVNNGEGIGLTLFTQYCSHHCRGCHNPETWSKNGGREFTEENLREIIDYFNNKKYATRFTLSGGDPIDSPQMALWIVSELKNKCPNIIIWLYSGYKFEEIKDNFPNIIQYIDILVDGRYIEDLRDVTLKFRGSSNQRVIDVQKSIAENKVVLYLE